MSKEDKETFWDSNLVIAIIIIVVIIIFIISLGSSDKSQSSTEDYESTEDKKRKAEDRHRKLVELIKKKKDLKLKLDKKFSRIYLTVRILIVIMITSYNLLLWKFRLINSIGDFVDYNEVVLLAFGIVLFLVSREFKGVNEMISYFKNSIENIVYGKYVSIKTDIEKNESELKATSTEIAKLNNNST
jgi:Na+/H+ antiporter NhaC